MLVHTLAAFALSVAQVTSPAPGTDTRPIGRSEVLLRESDVVFSRAEPLERVLRVSLGEGLTGARVDVATIELTIDVEGEPSSFVPFVLVAQAVEPDGPTGRPPDSIRFLSAAGNLGKIIVLTR